MPYQSTPVERIFHALGDATRMAVIERLSRGPASVSELAEPFSMALPSFTQHLGVLEGAGLIRREIRGRTHVCHLEPGPLASAHAWLGHYENFWNHHLDVLGHLLREEDLRSSRPPTKE